MKALENCMQVVIARDVLTLDQPSFLSFRSKQVFKKQLKTVTKITY